MKKGLYRLSIAIFLCVATCTYGQEMTVAGFWLVEKVMVGKESMTPVAKWTKINPNGTFQSGNGWLQNSKGNWTFDASSNTFSAKDKLGPVDEFGGFIVSFENDKMIWEREEEGMPVMVQLTPINKLPMSPADYLVGLWDLLEITENEKSVTTTFDPENKHRLFIRWDRNYRDFTSEGNKQSGYWHINAHRPIITLLPHKEDTEPESWHIEVGEKELKMTGLSDSNKGIMRIYERRNKF